MSPTGAAAELAVLLGCALAIGIAATRVDPSGVVRVACEIGALVAALYAAELVIRIVAPLPGSTQQERRWDAGRLGLPFDARSKSEVVTELRARGIDAFPGLSREAPRSASVRQQLPEELYPLSDASNADVVECNEGGRYLIFHSDELGFNNPPGLVLSGRVDAALVGASFGQGHCIADGHSFANLLRSSFPRLANFSMPGSSALSMLATFREYVEPLRPPLVLWVMQAFTVDTHDEMANPILSRYLDPGFSQHLLERRQEVDQTWRSIAIAVQYEADHRNALAVQAAARDRFAGIVTLSALRAHLHLNEQLARRPAPVDLESFRRCLELARRTTEGWGGRFVVVLMPLYAEVVAHEMPPPLRHGDLAALLAGMGIMVIDAVPTFLAAPDPRSLYVMRRNNHPNEAGHRLLAEFVAWQLQPAGSATALVVHRGTR
jgi:hypothetical protein